MLQFANQLPLFSGVEEVQTFHDSSRGGYFSILADVNGKKKQSSYRLSEMPTVLNLIDTSRDTWISQAEFFQPNRRVVNLARIGLLFADLDTYRMPWAVDRSPESLADSVLYFCRDENLPPPSLLIFSGRGIQAKWLLEGTLPRAALPRWNACQRYLIDRLKPAGADVAAKDASRVLRLVQTVNSKSGEICRVVHVTTGLDGQPVRYNFEEMAETLLPVARWDIEMEQEQRKARRQKRHNEVSRTQKQKPFKLLDGGKANSNLRGFSGIQLAWHRLEDLRSLAKLRGGVREGERMKHLFWQLNFLLLSGATNSRLMNYEAKALAREVYSGWKYNESELSTLYAKSKQYEAGEKISFSGKDYPAFYTPRNDTLINLFEITDDEQRKLRTIISKGMAAERHKDRQIERRRAAGAVDREVYLKTVQQGAEAKQTEAQVLRAQGLSIRAIAAKMGASIGSISGYLKSKN